MTTQTKPQKFGRFGLRILVHHNRLEIKDGVWPFAKQKTVPFSNIASVGISRFTKRLEITTNDGKSMSYQLGNQRKAQRCEAAIMDRL